MEIPTKRMSIRKTFCNKIPKRISSSIPSFSTASNANIVPQISLVRYLTFCLRIFGFAAVIVAVWWKQGWVLASAIIFIIISIIMFKSGAGYFGIIQDAALRLFDARKANVDLSTAQREFDDARNSQYPPIADPMNKAVNLMVDLRH